MRKYNIGDKVRIKEDLIMGDNYIFWINAPIYTGKISKITDIYIDGENVDYILDIDGGLWSWSYDMLEPVEDKDIDMTVTEIFKVIQEGEYYVGKDNCKVIYKKNGDIHTEGFDGIFDIKETFYRAEKVDFTKIFEPRYHYKKLVMFVGKEQGKQVYVDERGELCSSGYSEEIKKYYTLNDLAKATFIIK